MLRSLLLLASFVSSYEFLGVLSHIMDFWDFYDQTVEELVILLVLTIILTSYNGITRGDCFSGALFTRQLLESPNRARIRSFIRMKLLSENAEAKRDD